jgi:hypothetical protein
MTMQMIEMEEISFDNLSDDQLLNTTFKTLEYIYTTSTAPVNCG